MPSPLIDQVKRLRDSQARREIAEIARMVQAYQQINERAGIRAEALALKIVDTYNTTGTMPTRAQIMRLSQYRELMNTVETELGKYEAFMRVELSISGRLAITEGERDARTLAKVAAQGMKMDAAFRALNPATIEQLVGFLDPQGPLYKRLGLLSGWTAEQVSNTIIEGVGMGFNPRKTARMLTKSISDGITESLGMGLSDSMRMMRTVQLWSYREANRASYIQNNDVVRGWIWYAELDGDTCASCVAMHGTEHTLDEVLDDHHNGRCSMLPWVIGADNPVEKKGAEWFDSISEAEQKQILGETKWGAWNEGKFKLSDVSGTSEDSVYGTMRVERSLKDLLGEREASSVDV